MKRTSGNECEARIEDLAACATGETSLSAEAAAHLRECAECQEKVAELKSVAAIHERGAARLPEPRLRLKRRQLERLLEEERGEGRRGAEFRRLRLVVAGGAVAVVLALILASVVLRREPVESRQVPAIDVREAVSAVEAANAIVPTMLALHHEARDGRERLLASMPLGDGVKHYRVGDVASELKNFRE
jgi:hypothetical protein